MHLEGIRLLDLPVPYQSDPHALPHIMTSPKRIQKQKQNVPALDVNQALPNPQNPPGTRSATRLKRAAEHHAKKVLEQAALLEDGAVLEKAALLEKVARLEAQEKKHQKERRQREEDETTALQAKIADLEAKRNAREETVGERERREKKDLQREAGERSLSAGYVATEEE